MFLRRDEQRLGRREEAASTGARATGLVAAAHRGGDRGPPRDGQRLPEGGRDRGAEPWRPAERVAAKTGHHAGGVHRLWPSKPATTPGVSTDPGRQNRPFRRRCPPTPARMASAAGRAPSASACEPYRELIAEALGRGRNAVAIWQDLVDDHGFRARYASVRRFVRDAARHARRPRRASSSRPRPARKARSTTARGRWCATRHGQVPTHAALRPDARATRASRCGCWCGARARRSGPSCTSAPFAGSAARRASSSSTICTRACSRPTSTTPRSIRSIATCSRTTASSRCRAASRDPDRKGKVEAGVGHAQKTPLQGPALRDASRRRRRTSIAGRRAGPTRASTARRSGRSP